MRVTQSMLSNNMLRNLTNSYERLGKYQDQLASQKKISRPSDDPVVAMKGIQYRSQLVEVEQFQRNLSDVYNWLENSEDALEKAGSVIQRVSELVTGMANGSMTNDDRLKAESEIQQIKEHLISIANTKIADKYIFGGTNTSQEPLTYDSTTDTVTSYNGNNEVIQIEVSPGVKLPVNTFASDIFFKADGTGLIQDLEKLQAAVKDPTLGENDPELQGFITSMQNHLDKIVSSRSNVGSRMNRAELVETRLSSNEIISSKMISDNEDIDIEEVIMKFKIQESVHRAALSVGSSIIQPTLVDFMR